MPKIQEMIDQTQKQVQEKLQQAQQLEQGIQQAQQSLQQTISEYHTLVARLNTLQEVAGAGAGLFKTSEEEKVAASEGVTTADGLHQSGEGTSEHQGSNNNVQDSERAE